MGQSSISFNESDDYIEHIDQLERDIIELNIINRKDKPSIMDEVKLILMSGRIKKNMELASIVMNTLRTVHAEERHIYYHICGLLNFAVKTIEAFNSKQMLM